AVGTAPGDREGEPASCGYFTRERSTLACRPAEASRSFGHVHVRLRARAPFVRCSAATRSAAPEEREASAERPLPPRLDGRARFAIRFAALDRLALVVVLLALRQADGHLHASVLEIETRRDERHPFFDGLADQLADLAAVQQQFSAAQRLMIGIPAVAVRADVHVVEKHLAVLDESEAVAQVHAPFPDRLHLGAEQDQPRLDPR